MGMVGIIDPGMGNIHSVANAFDSLGAEARIFSSPAGMDACERLVLLGVGAFGDCLKNLHALAFVAALHRLVLERKRPILGICLGMQVMAERGFEGGETPGLGWFAGEVRRIDPGPESVRVPHVGWNNLEVVGESPLFAGIPRDADFYFVHSFSMRCRSADDVTARCDYGAGVTAAIQRGNVFATQFHPEKSQEHGLRLLENFLSWEPRPC